MTLLREKTKEVYKYYPEDLPSKTSSPVIIQCNFCLEEFSLRWKMFINVIGRNSKLHHCNNCIAILKAYVKTDRSIPPTVFHEQWTKDYLVLDYVDLEQTQLKYRYDPRKVKYNEIDERMRVVIQCKRCFEKYDVQLSHITKYGSYTGLCLSCGKQTSDKVINKQATPKLVSVSMEESDRYSGVLTQATIEKFGIDPDALKPNSSSLVIVKCAACNGPTETKLSYFLKQNRRVSCSKECRKKLYDENMATRHS